MESLARNSGRELAGQVLRYGASGVALAALYAAVYWVLAARLAIAPQLANGAGFLAALLTGYVLHSRWSFRGHGTRQWSWSRFLVVNFAGYLLNCLWVWLIVDHFGAPVWISILPIVTLTPAFTFLLNRRWTFA